MFPVPRIPEPAPDPGPPDPMTGQVTTRIRDSSTAFSEASPAERTGAPGRCRPCKRCGDPAPRTSRTGRPPELCARCRGARSRPAREPEGPAAPFADRQFSRTLRQAIGRTGASLRDICDDLSAAGFRVSPATLSAWQRGHYEPRPSELILALERVVKLGAGTLFLPLQAGGRRSRGGRRAEPAGTGGAVPSVDRETRDLQDHLARVTSTNISDYITTVVDERVSVDPDGKPTEICVQQQVRAVRDEVNSYWLIHAADTGGTRTHVRAGVGCRVGHRVLLGADRTAVQLLFDRRLGRGDDHWFSFMLSHRYTGLGEPFHRRSISSHTVEAYTSRVAFAAPPRQVWLCEWPDRAGPPLRRRQAKVESSVACLYLRRPAPGTYGMLWSQ